MRFAHISDLHLGKRLNGFSMMEDQRYILAQIVEIISDKDVDGVIIAGDIYDKSVPSAEAVALFDEFITSLCRLKKSVYIISGNHDSPERIAYGGKIMETADIYVSPVYDGTISRITKHDQYGELNIYLLPFIKPGNVRSFYPEEDTSSYTAALRTAISHGDIDKSARNIIVSHQFITGAQTCDSEDISSVGTLDCVDVGVFEDFDYAALGHIHGAQRVGRDTVRYCGTPLKYSFSECGHKKSVTIAELKEKCSVVIETYPLKPMHDMREIRGCYEELMQADSYAGTDTEDYIRVTLTDEQDIPNVMDKMRTVYKNIMELRYDNKRTRNIESPKEAEGAENKSPLELFSQLYRQQNNGDMTEEQTEYVSSLIEKIWSDEE